MCCLIKKAIVSVLEYLTGEGMHYLNLIESIADSMKNQLWDSWSEKAKALKKTPFQLVFPCLTICKIWWIWVA